MKNLDLSDIQSFDPELGRTLAEFQSLVDRKRSLESVHGMGSNLENNPCFRGSKIEDLCLEFTIPGYPDYVLATSCDYKMVKPPRVPLLMNLSLKLYAI